MAPMLLNKSPVWNSFLVKMVKNEYATKNAQNEKGQKKKKESRRKYIEGELNSRKKI